MDVHEAPANACCEVIPVIDLAGGLVVHARLGDRAHYRPIRSRLCSSARVEDVVPALLGLHRFRRLYIADVDALRGRSRQWHTIDTLARIASGVELWIDAGVRNAGDLAAVMQRGTPVLATETLSAPAAALLLEACPEAVLSVDYDGDRFLGQTSVLERLPRWPLEVIAMDIGRAGSDLGPDLTRIGWLRRLAPRARLYVAGGVRGGPDLQQCRRAGAAGALVASALHDGRIGPADLAFG